MGLGVESVTGVFGTFSIEWCKFSSAVSKASLLSSRLERASLYLSMQARSESFRFVTVALSMKSYRCFCGVPGG